MNDYHVFKKQRVKKGRVIHKWYYYFAVNGLDLIILILFM
jgi:hypothetical protein